VRVAAGNIEVDAVERGLVANDGNLQLAEDFLYVFGALGDADGGEVVDVLVDEIGTRDVIDGLATDLKTDRPSQRTRGQRCRRSLTYIWSYVVWPNSFL
jgi:hypothetical protein